MNLDFINDSYSTEIIIILIIERIITKVLNYLKEKADRKERDRHKKWGNEGGLPT